MIKNMTSEITLDRIQFGQVHTDKVKFSKSSNTESEIFQEKEDAHNDSLAAPHVSSLTVQHYQA